MLRTMANSPAALEAYLAFNSALQEGLLPPTLRQQIALAIADLNSCDYCLAVYTALSKMVGFSEERVMQSRRGVSPDGRTEAALRFARHIIETNGWVTDEEFSRVQSAGYSEGEIAEVVANVALSIFANYFNHVAGTEVDSPIDAPPTTP